VTSEKCIIFEDPTSKGIIKWLWIFLILIGLEGSLLPLTELHVHRAILRVRLINLMSQLVRTQI
jgi:hypothetical protein